MQPIFLTCENCHNRFKGAAATPSIIMRIEIPCPACNHQNKTPYGLVTPFFDQLFYINGSAENPAIGSKILLSKLGLNNSEAHEKEAACLAEIFNAYLLWLENDNLLKLFINDAKSPHLGMS